MSFIEQTLQINDLDYAFKLWGEAEDTRFIALHGWLDNAGSFDLLAPKLKGFQIAALDLAGQGLSGFRHPQASYNIWDDLLDILALADYLAWDQFSLLGHSRGAIISFLLACAVPDRIHKVVLLDGVWPMPGEAEEAPRQLANYLRDIRQAGNKFFYSSKDAALNARCRASRSSRGLHRAAAEILAERSLGQTTEGFYWRSDPRLTKASAFKMTKAHISAFIDSLKVPALACLAEKGFGDYTEFLEELQKYSQFKVKVLAGSHHFHMEEGPSGEIAQLITDFMER